MNSTTQASLTWPQALGWRMDRQFLDPVGSGSVAEVVGRLGAVLSMDESLAELAVRTRRSTSRPGELAAALADGEVVQAYAFRGSKHYLSPVDGGIYLAIRAAGRQWELPSWVEYYRLAPADWPDFRAAVRAALTDGPLTVAELGEALARTREYRHLKPVFDGGAGTLIKPLSWQGDACIAPPRDNKLTLQRFDANPRWQGVPELDDAGPRAVLAYVRGYGPATLEHVRYWLGSGLSAGRKRLDSWVAALGDQLVPVDVGGTVAYAARDDVDSLVAGKASDAVRMLPGHDQWGDGRQHQGHPGHPGPAARPDDPQGQPGGRRRRRERHLGAQGRRPHGQLARRSSPAHGGHRGRGRAAVVLPGSRATRRAGLLKAVGSRGAEGQVPVVRRRAGGPAVGVPAAQPAHARIVEHAW